MTKHALTLLRNAKPIRYGPGVAKVMHNNPLKGLGKV